MQDMSLSEAQDVTYSLSKPSKMPGFGYSIPAIACMVGSLLREVEGSTCAGCYAMKGRYRWPTVEAALNKRLESLDDPRWVEAMVTQLSTETVRATKYFRWHDSGDLKSFEHLVKIVEVANATPWMKHWLPTREYGIVKEYLERHGAIPDNLVIRLSAQMVDGPPPSWWPWTSGVQHKKPVRGYPCPAQHQDNKCGECRACWSRRIKHVDYHKH